MYIRRFCGSCSGKMAFQVSQGNQVSVATYAKCGGKHDKSFIANSVLNPKVRTF